MNYDYTSLLRFDFTCENANLTRVLCHQNNWWLSEAEASYDRSHFK